MPSRARMFVPAGTPPAAVTDPNRIALQRFYCRAAWKKARAAHLNTHPICSFIDHPTSRHECLRAATEVDHRVPIARGGKPLDPANFRSACKVCHSKVTRNYQLTRRNEMPDPKNQPA